VETGREPDSDFEIAVIDLLRNKGYEVTPQLGVAGYRIDVAVRHPDYPSAYIAAIECDGATYHSGVSVRDRDRIRQEILESLGWKGKIWRIWSTDFFRNPRAEAQKLFDFLESLRHYEVPLEYRQTSEEPPAPPAAVHVPSVVTPIQSHLFDEQRTDTSSRTILTEDDDQQDFEIEVGDLVTYCPTERPDEEMSVRITAHQTDVSRGFIAQHTPLAKTLLGATAGETVVLRVPAMPVQALRILEVRRPEGDVAA
jgi:very-short-patch-repair endonuclease